MLASRNHAALTGNRASAARFHDPVAATKTYPGTAPRRIIISGSPVDVTRGTAALGFFGDGSRLVRVAS